MQGSLNAQTKIRDLIVVGLRFIGNEYGKSEYDQVGNVELKKIPDKFNNTDVSSAAKRKIRRYLNGNRSETKSKLFLLTNIEA